MPELVAIGRAPERVLRRLRELAASDNRIVVYPEFYDSKRCLVNKHDLACLRSYMRQLWLRRKNIRVAVWPDYRGVLQLPKNPLYVYPIHEESDWDRLMRVEDAGYRVIPGYPRGLCYLSVYGFYNIALELGYKAWLMGLTPRYIRYASMFYGVDLTTYSIPGYNHEKIRRDGAEALYKLAVRLLEGRVDEDITNYTHIQKIYVCRYDIFYGQRCIEKALRMILEEMKKERS